MLISWYVFYFVFWFRQHCEALEPDSFNNEHTVQDSVTASLTTQTRRQACRHQIGCRPQTAAEEVGMGVAHRVMRSVPLRDWLALGAARSSLGWAEPMAWWGGVLGLPGQQVKQSGKSKALHIHTDARRQLFLKHRGVRNIHPAICGDLFRKEMWFWVWLAQGFEQEAAQIDYHLFRQYINKAPKNQNITSHKQLVYCLQ